MPALRQSRLPRKHEISLQNWASWQAFTNGNGCQIKQRFRRTTFQKTDSLSTAKTLGVLRNANEDTFSFNYSFTPDMEFTKRNVLKKTATIYDPLGFLAPYVVRTKLLIQQAVGSKQQIEKIHYCSTRNNGSHGSKNPQV